MTSYGNICRICSGTADYEIFAKIPVYLHGATNEFLDWQKPINLLLEETTGLKNSPHDGLPRYICAPCISYLKHAVSFRDQCIKNAISLKLATLYQQKPVNIDDTNKIDKEAALFTATDLLYVERPAHDLLLKNSVKPNLADKVHKQLLNQTVPTLGNNEQGVQCLNVLFDKEQNASLRQKDGSELPTTSAGSRRGKDACEDEYYHYPAASSSDENDENNLARQDKNCYNYSETNFEDDDPMDDMGMRDIKVNIPEPKWKERKCPACYKLFMLEDTYKSHICNCVENQFLALVTEMNKLLSIRQQKMLSPHEFIRRMIFTLHKTCTWLQEHSIDNVLTEKLNQVKLSYNGSNGKTTELLDSWAMSSPRETAAETLKWPVDLDNPLDDDFEPFFFASGSATPITAENNVLYAIERSESRNSQSAPQVKKPIPIRGTVANSHLLRSPHLVKMDTKQNNATERATFLEKLQRAAVTEQVHPLRMTPPSSVTAPMSFSARCSQCNLMFDSVSELEVHNIKHHNTPNAQQAVDTNSSTTDDARRQIIALFEDDI